MIFLEKNIYIFVALPSHFSKFSLNVTFISIFVLMIFHYDDINGVGTIENIFCEIELCIIQDKDKSKVMILFS